jgi:hypothetical protein
LFKALFEPLRVKFYSSEETAAVLVDVTFVKPAPFKIESLSFERVLPLNVPTPPMLLLSLA